MTRLDKVAVIKASELYQISNLLRSRTTTTINQLNINRSRIPEAEFKSSFLPLIVKRLVVLRLPPPPKSQMTWPQAQDALPNADLLWDQERLRQIGTHFTELGKLFKAHGRAAERGQRTKKTAINRQLYPCTTRTGKRHECKVYCFTYYSTI